MSQRSSPRTNDAPGVDFRICGIPVRLEGTFVLMAVILGQGRQGWWVLGWCLVVFVSILIHELGHAVTLRSFGDSPRIRLWAFGGLTYPTKRLSPARDVLVSLAGSTAQLLLLGIPAYFLRESLDPRTLTEYRWWMLLTDLVWVSVGWAVLNLLPILPLDGGNATRRVLGHRAGRRGEVVATWLSMATASAAGVWALAAAAPFAALYALFFVGWNATTLFRERDQRARARVDEGRRSLRDGDREGAIDAFREGMALARTHAARSDAGEALAWTTLENGDLRKAREIAERLRPDPADPSSLLPSLDLFEGRDIEAALDAIVAWWLRHPSGHVGGIVIVEIDRRGLAVAFVERLLRDPSPKAAELAAATQASLHFRGRYRSSIEVGRLLLDDRRIPSALVAYNIACSSAREGHRGSALDWLDVAVETGFGDVGQLLNDEDLAEVRLLPRFSMILGRLGARRGRTPGGNSSTPAHDDAPEP